MDKILVTKRDGSVEEFDLEKINRVVAWAVETTPDVSLSDIEINAKLNIRDGISTQEIHNVLIESAANLIRDNTPNYQFVAAKLMNYHLRKSIWGGKNPPRLYDFLKHGVDIDIYDPILLEKYSESEINKIGEMIDHDRDFLFTYAGIKQLCDKYLIKNRITGQIFETPQFAYILISMAGFINYPVKTRLSYIKKAYNYFSKFKINLPTPIMAGMRTKLRSYASCCLIGVDDTKESLTASNTAMALATAARYGIGFEIGRVRPINSPVRGGETVHTGLIPFLKMYESSVKAWQQNGLRGGGATCNLPWWHAEIEDVIVLKNNAGTDDNRVRKLDYTVGMDKVIYERFLKDQEVTLLSPKECVGLYDAFGHPEFEALYVKYENDPSIKIKKKISARDFMSLLVKERTETGRIYILNVDHANSHGSWLDSVKMSNLCTEVTHPTIPLQDFNDPNGEIGVCILAAINLMEIKGEDELQRVCDIIVRFLDELIDVQEYFNQAAKNFATKRRSLGVGLTNLAALLAKNELKFSDPEAPNFVDGWMENIQYHLLGASIELAKEKGPCEKFDRTKYSLGILPIDTYKKSVDKFVTRKPAKDWEVRRKEIETHGLRNSTLSSMMPCESSSVIQSSTNGCDPLRSILTYKTSKASKLPVLAPGVGKWEENYELAFDLQDNIGLINVHAAIQKWTDMAISTNLYYNYSHYPDNKLPDTKVMKEIVYAYSVGLKSLYYNVTDDGDVEQSLAQDKADSCASGACTI